MQTKWNAKTSLAEIREALVAEVVTDEEGAPSADEVKAAFSKTEKSVVRTRVIAGEPRIDGREHDMVRARLYIRTGVLPRTHGSALFTRGETQALVVATLGTERDAQIQDGILRRVKRNLSCCIITSLHTVWVKLALWARLSVVKLVTVN